MARFVIQSTLDFQFVAFDPRTRMVGWTSSLAAVMCYGVVDDEQTAQEMAAEYCDRGCFQIVDLDSDLRG